MILKMEDFLNKIINLNFQKYMNEVLILCQNFILQMDIQR